MPAGSPQFTPRQLLDAGRRAEGEGKLDLAHQFYGHLCHHYGNTAEAAEGRHALSRIAPPGHQPDVWQTNGGGASLPALNGKMQAGRPLRVKQSAHRTEYRVGRALAALVSAAGWLIVAGALLALVAEAAAEFAQVQSLQGLKLGLSTPQSAGALLAGAGALLVGQAARALFDQASATRELVTLERAKAGRERL